MEQDVEVERVNKPNEITLIGGTAYSGLAQEYHSETQAIKVQRYKLTIHGSTHEEAVRFLLGYGQVYFHREKLILYCNAQDLITMSRKMLCEMQPPTLYEIMKGIKQAILEIDPALSIRMVPNCVYRGGYCFEKQNCGMFPSANINHYQELYA